MIHLSRIYDRAHSEYEYHFCIHLYKEPVGREALYHFYFRKNIQKLEQIRYQQQEVHLNSQYSLDLPKAHTMR